MMPVTIRVGRRWPWVLVGALTLVAAVGCGRKMCPVEGKVVYRDGAPVSTGMVIFEGLEPDLVKRCSRGYILKDGSFRMGTERDDDGVPEGHYRVLIVPPVFGGGGEGDKGMVVPKIDPKYERFPTSPLEYTVVRGKNEVTFEIDRATPRRR